MSQLDTNRKIVLLVAKISHIASANGEVVLGDKIFRHGLVAFKNSKYRYLDDALPDEVVK